MSAEKPVGIVSWSLANGLEGAAQCSALTMVPLPAGMVADIVVPETGERWQRRHVGGASALVEVREGAPAPLTYVRTAEWTRGEARLDRALNGGQR